MYIKKSFFVSSLVACGLVFGTVGIFAASGVEKIQVFLNHDIKFLVNGSSWTPKDNNGKVMAPIVYNGYTYLPARAVSEAVGASVKYESSSQTIQITASGTSSSNEGVPYNDDTDSTSTSPAATPAPTAKPTATPAPTAKPSTTPTPSSTSSSSFKTNWPANVTLSSVSKENKTQVVQLLKYFSAALETNDYSQFNSYVDKYVEDKTETNKYFEGKDYSKKLFKETVEGLQKANDKNTIKKYAAALKNATVSDIKDGISPYKSVYSMDVSFNFIPEDFSAYSSTYVYFKYQTFADGSFGLSSIDIH
ncbi:stalk domain-containing protein [Paenibacillus sp. Leaf72]|uniref:stalk domain-containing protein n=1 Tax=Paenibacillus sp. Leaf72 TaxID=1736234 RepID=UPI0006F69E95|nr:stalk domain-containing protein [Paenibacillus sp. Leaf72]KQO15358.1 hypothetical protein ASF12_28170 [Paenibacillus sp. Leaf72]